MKTVGVWATGLKGLITTPKKHMMYLEFTCVTIAYAEGEIKCKSGTITYLPPRPPLLFPFAVAFMSPNTFTLSHGSYEVMWSHVKKPHGHVKQTKKNLQ